MSEYQLKKARPGVRSLTLAVGTTTNFKDLVKILERTLTVPELPGIKGCAPCLSGLDRVLIQDETLSTLR
ncbi:MAG TPA: hypothetical protein VGS22_24180 [Thermoanaerobaculia bacterium]|jgi:hypothetical protein|nr:hypothetical protein [Thermoanaerobaculia bacterium]